MRRRRDRRVRLAGAALLLGAAGAATGWPSWGHAAPGAGPAVVPITVTGGQGTRGGAHPTVEVRVGDGRPVPVLLDTGSVGLHLYAGAVPRGSGSGVTVTTRKNSITYIDDTVQRGVVARATITVGSLRTTTPVAFSLVRKVSCTAAVPKCPGQGGLAAAEQRGLYGTLGVGLGPGPVDNPLVHLAAPYSGSWSISLAGSLGHLTLGAPIPRETAARFSIPADGKRANGTRTFADKHAVVCWTVGSQPTTCEYTLFDSGDVGMQFFGGPPGHAPAASGGALVSGTPVMAAGAASALPFWTFTAGTTTSSDTVHVHPSGNGTVNAAVQSFYAFTVNYDARHGLIALTEAP